MPFLQNIKKLLSSRSASVIIFLLAAAGRVIQKIYFLSPSGDKATQLLATKNLLNGHGISTLEVFSNNLADAQYIPLIKWPPGYSLLLAPFYNLSGEDFIWGSMWPDLIAAVLFVWFARKTICLFDVPVYLVNLYTLIAGFCLYDFATSSSSDLVTAMFYQLALFLTLRFILSEKKSYTSAFVIATVLFICGFTRYMSLPLAFIIPFYFIVSGYINRNRKFVLSGFFMVGTLIIFTALLLGIQSSYGGSPAYVMPSEKGFYPGNLFTNSPFIFSSLFNINLFCVQVEKISGMSFSSIAQVVCNVHLIVFIAALIFSFSWLMKRKLRNPSLTDHFVYIGLFSTLAVVAILAYLSITNAAIFTSPTDTWTFIQEGRYFFIPVLFVQLFVILAAWQHRNSSKKWQTGLLTFCMAILLLNTVHSIYFTAKKVIPSGRSIYKHQEEVVVMDYFKSLLDTLIRDNRDKNIIVSSPDDSYTHYAGLWFGLPGFADYSKLNTQQLSTQKETIIVVPVSNNDRFRLSEFISNTAIKLVGQINDHSFYTINVSPNNQ